VCANTNLYLGYAFKSQAILRMNLLHLMVEKVTTKIKAAKWGKVVLLSDCYCIYSELHDFGLFVKSYR